MKTQRKLATLAATLLTFGSLAGGAYGAVNVIWQQDGADVTATWSGTLSVSSLTDTTRDSVSNDFVSSFSLYHFDVNSSGLGFYSSSSNAGSAQRTSLNFIDETPSGESLASFGFSRGALFWNDVHISSGAVGNVTELTFDPIRDIIRFSNTDLNTVGADSFSNTLAWTANTTADTISYTTVSPVPEPSSAILLGLGALGAVARRKRTS